MPRGDGTGPQGMGAMTGRGAGYCGGSGMPGSATAPAGRGFGAGFGRGGGVRGSGFGVGWPGYRCRFSPARQGAWNRFRVNPTPMQAVDPELEKQALKNQVEILQSELESIKTRLAELARDNSQE